MVIFSTPIAIPGRIYYTTFIYSRLIWKYSSNLHKHTYLWSSIHDKYLKLKKNIIAFGRILQKKAWQNLQKLEESKHYFLLTRCDSAFASIICCTIFSSEDDLFPLTPTNGCEQRQIVAWESGCIQDNTGKRPLLRNFATSLNSSSETAFGTANICG